MRCDDMHQKATPVSSGVRIDADIRRNCSYLVQLQHNDERGMSLKWRLSTDKILGCPSECTDFECASALALLVSTTTAAIQLCTHRRVAANVAQGPAFSR